MKKFMIFLFALNAVSAELTRLPSEFQVVEQFFSLTSTFDISTEVEQFAIARKRFFSLTTCFDLEDMNQLPLATANSRFFAWGTVADVTDPQGTKIGWIEEEIFKIVPWSEYKVFNSTNQLVAIAKMNFWGTQFELYHPDHPTDIYATINRPFFQFFRDYWTVQIKNYEIFEQGYIDPRLLIILAIYQTDKDKRDQFRSQFYFELNREQYYYDGLRIDP
jgi:uncharacterized protein YxjI